MNDIENKLNNIQQLNLDNIGGYNSMKYIKNEQSNKFKQRVAQYDIRGNLIRTYDSVKETEQSGYRASSVSKCIHNKLKLHDRSIFIKIKQNQKPSSKIDPTPYTNNKNSNLGLNNLIVSDILNETTKPEETQNTQMTVKLKKPAIGMFNKKGMLLDIFITESQITKMFGHSSGVYDHLYNRIKTKSKLRKGYKNKFFFRKLDNTNTYNIGDKYDLSSFTPAQPRKMKPKKIVNQKVKNKINNTPKIKKEEKKSLLQKIVGFFIGK